jgi:hypothetical protein
LYVAPAASAATAEEEVLQVLNDWTKSFATADFKLWSSIHWNSSKASSFAPAKGGAFLTQGYEAIVNSIKSVLEYPVGTYVCSIHNPQVTTFGDNMAIITFYQIFTISPPAVKEQIIEHQRVTFVVQKIGGKWVIVHDHGSYLPTE